MIFHAEHLPSVLIASYALGFCTRSDRGKVEWHLIECPDCRTQFAVLARVPLIDEALTEQPELKRLAPLGIEAAERARRSLRLDEMKWRNVSVVIACG